MAKSVLKVRCPSCKGQTWLSTDSFNKLRSQLSAAVDHDCEHCGHRFATTLAGPTGQPPATATTATPPPPPPVERPYQPPAPPPAAAVPFTPRTDAAPGAPPFGLLGERREDQPGKSRPEVKLGSPPPFAAGPSHSPSGAEKKTFNEWWKSQTPGRQWTMLGCLLVTVACIFIILPDSEPAPVAKKGKGKGKDTVSPEKKKSEEAKTGEAKSPETKNGETKAAEPKTTTETKQPVEPKTTAETKQSVESTPKVEKRDVAASTTALDDAMGLLCVETTTADGKFETPLAPAWAVDGKGFVVRAAKVFADSLADERAVTNWFVATPTKRYRVKSVRYHPEFPIAKLKDLAGKKKHPDVLKLVQDSERFDVALVETVEAPNPTLRLPTDFSSIQGKPRMVVVPVEPKPSLPSQPIEVRFSRKPEQASMFKGGGGWISLGMPPGADAVVISEDGLLAAFIPRKNAGEAAIHPIITGQAIKELLSAK